MGALPGAPIGHLHAAGRLAYGSGPVSP